MADAKIIERIQGLLRMADPDKNPNENEREVAQQKAQLLMFKHNLNLMAVTEKEGAGGIKEDEGKTVKGITNQWRGKFLWYIGKAWFCDGWVSQYDRSHSKWTIVGKPENIAFVHALYEHLVPWLEIECAAEIKRHRPHNPKAFKRAFYEAASQRIHFRLLSDVRRMEEDANTDAAGSGTALVKIETAAVAKYMEEKNLRKGRARGYGNLAGRVTGDAAGRKANLNTGNKIRPGGGRKELGR